MEVCKGGGRREVEGESEERMKGGEREERSREREGEEREKERRERGDKGG